jgi:hypothetical protein
VQPSGIPLSVALAGHDANSDEGVELPLCRTDVPQKYQLLSPLYKPVTLEFAFDDATGAVTLKNLSVPSKPKSLALNGHALSLNDPIVLEPAEQAPVAAVQDVPTTPINAPEPADLQPPEKL